MPAPAWRRRRRRRSGWTSPTPSSSTTATWARSSRRSNGSGSGSNRPERCPRVVEGHRNPCVCSLSCRTEVVGYEQMFDSLAAAIDDLSVPVDPRELRVLLGLHDRLTAKVTVAVGEADVAGVWSATGATSMRAWLCDEGLSGPDATRLARLAAHVHRLPVLRSAWTTGDLSNGQVRAITAQLTSRNVGLFADHESEVVPSLVGLSVAETNRA